MNKESFIGTRIKELRIKKGVSQQEMAQSIGIARSTLAGYECGNIMPSTQVLMNICDYLDISVNSFMLPALPKNKLKVIDIYLVMNGLANNIKNFTPVTYNDEALSKSDIDFLLLQIDHFLETMNSFIDKR